MSVRYNTTKELVENMDPGQLKLNQDKLIIPAKEKKEPKYHNQPTESFGVVFQSGKEASDYGKLMLGIRSGDYAFVLRQVPFVLQEKPEKIVYVADFVVGNMDGTWEAIDSKGMITDSFSLKRRLFRKKYHQDIKII